MQNKFMSMSVLMAAMMGVGLVGCSTSGKQNKQKQNPQQRQQRMVTRLKWYSSFTFARWHLRHHLKILLS